jgi:hypothetical protein
VPRTGTDQDRLAAWAQAWEILDQTSGKPATFDKLGQTEVRIDAIARTDPELADALKAGKKVEVKIDIIHSADVTRPERFVVTTKIDSEQSRKIFTNQPGG